MLPLHECFILGLLLPLAGFIFLALRGARLGKPQASLPAIASILLSLLCATYVLIQWWWLLDDTGRSAATEAARAAHVLWFSLGEIPIQVGVQLDSLTVAMYFMVTLVGSCIFIFSVGYMSGESDRVDGRCHYHRFFAYLSLFAFSMLGLVISSSLLLMFVFWELVGVCSYLLIGFYFDRKYASNAAMKAFVVNRVGDFGFLIGLGLLAAFVGDLSIDGAIQSFASQYPDDGLFGANITLAGWTLSGTSVATLMGVALFCGCIGKSAQVPLQVWLPDAMAGPTPVSALIHAATMVAAGVYLVARIFPLLTPDAQFVVAIIGCITLTIAALVAIVQTDIKKALAYSTLSQLGYMVFGMGCGAWTGALFHLITHAFFKAMLFLGAGQVIEGCHHVQDIRQMGGLRKKMPVTCWTFFIGVLAISGVGLPNMNTIAFTGLGGYYSKDEILAVAYFRSYGESTHEEQHTSKEHGMVAGTSGVAGEIRDIMDEPHRDDVINNAHLLGTPRMPKLPGWLFVLAAITAYVTPFYMMRLWWVTFMGKPRDAHVHEHAHESSLMKWPLVALAVGTALASWNLLPFRPLLAEASIALDHTSPLIAPLDGHDHLLHTFVAGPLTGWIWPAFLVGFLLAILVYRDGLKLANRISRLPVVRVTYGILTHKYYFDEIYDVILVKGTRTISALSGWADKWILDFTVIENLARSIRSMAFFTGNELDAGGVDRMAEGLGQGAFKVGDLLRSTQTGKIRQYVLFSVTSALLVVMVIVWM